MQFLSKLLLNFFGWSFSSDGPILNKCVLIAAPHTSNWDFPMMLAYGFKLNLKYYWLGKNTLFFGPIGVILRKLGGISVDRSKKNDFVSILSKEIAMKEECILIIPPEGTRSRSNHWRSGFLHIARTADVPIVFGRLDYKKRNLTFSRHISGRLSDKEIMEFAAMFYVDVSAYNPANFGPVQLKKKS